MSLTSKDASAQEATIQGTADAFVEAWNDEELDTFVTYFTDGGLMHIFEGYAPGDDKIAAAEANRAEAGPIAAVLVSDIKVSSPGSATAIVELQFEFGFVLYEEWSFVNSGDGWQVDGGEPASRPIPPGVPVVDLNLDEYEFDYNPGAMLAADGNFAFSVTNVGEEEHEVVVLKNSTSDSILEVFATAGEGEDLPEGIEFVAFGGFFAPGTSGTVVFDQPLGAGNYGLICFIPSPDGTPHAFLGMVSEFTIGSQVVDGPGITPPNTGDGGLVGSQSSYYAAGLLVIVILGVAALVVSLRAA